MVLLEPITIILLTSALIAAMRSVPVVIKYASDKIIGIYRHLFEGRNLLIFGSVGSGKTSLIQLLTTGKPYYTDQGQIQEPNATSVIAITGKQQASSELKLKNINARERIKRDVPGETKARKDWRKVIEEINPEGIIYMVDSRLDGDKLSAAVIEIFTDVLSAYQTNLRNLRALHIFMNFSDSLTDQEKLLKKDCIRSVFDNRFNNQNYNHLRPLRVQTSYTQLSSKGDPWLEVKDALEKFGDDLRRVR